MGYLILLSLVAALGLGVYVGLGAPGYPGRQNKVVSSGRARRLEPRHLDWLRPRKR
jgi:hypothetical protein